MARNVLVDAGFLIALLNRRDTHHQWAVTSAEGMPPPWSTCEAVLSDAYHLIGVRGTPSLGTLLRRGALIVAFKLGENVGPVTKLIEKYSDVPMSFADGCLVRILTTDKDFRVYRRHSRQVVPCVTPI
jgi:uncharacterized protein